MSELKTKKNDASVMAFLNSVENEKRREDALKINEIMTELSGETPAMWGDSIVGYGTQRLKYPSGRELDWMRIGFSPRKHTLTLYILAGSDRQEELLSQLGRYKTGKDCVYINKLEDVNMDVLRELIAIGLKENRSC